MFLLVVASIVFISALSVIPSEFHLGDCHQSSVQEQKQLLFTGVLLTLTLDKPHYPSDLENSSVFLYFHSSGHCFYHLALGCCFYNIFLDTFFYPHMPVVILSGATMVRGSFSSKVTLFQTVIQGSRLIPFCLVVPPSPHIVPKVIVLVCIRQVEGGKAGRVLGGNCLAQV